MFTKLGNLCGGLKLIDRKILQCEELQWVCLEVEMGSLCYIPCLISVLDLGRVYPVVVTIEGEALMAW